MQEYGTRLAGKVAIVTGAGTRGEVVGTGQATSILYARQGAKVLLVDLNQQNAEKTLATIEKEGGTASIFMADVTQSDQCQAMADEAVSRYGSIDILSNNVGIGSTGTVLDAEESEWDRVLDVNLKSMFLTSKFVIPRMIETCTSGGSIINIASIDGMRANWWPNISYAASKAGAIGMSRNMAVHHGRDNIRVNSIAPGHIFASMVGDMPDKLRQLRQQAGPLGTEGTAWDIAWASVFLASDEARWISGVVLPVDAGLFASTPLSMLRRIQDEA